LAEKEGVSLRPHVKTNKCIDVVRLQLGGKSGGIVCSTLAECEYFYENGIADITYGVPIEPSKFFRARLLSQKLQEVQGSFHVMIDSLDAFNALASFMGGVNTSVWLAVDAGYGREGVAHDSEEALAIVRAIQQQPGFFLRGLYSHSGDSYNCGKAGASRAGELESERMQGLAAKLTSQGLKVPVISLGATPSTHSGLLHWCSSPPAVPIELHPGNYCFFDRQQVACGSCSLEDVACYVLARVVSVYKERNALLLDAGSCAMHKDTGGLDTWGCLRDDPNMVLKSLTQEVSVVSTADGSAIDFSRYALGCPVRILPNHSCMTAAQHPVYHVTRGGKLVGQWTPCKFW